MCYYDVFNCSLLIKSDSWLNVDVQEKYMHIPFCTTLLLAIYLLFYTPLNCIASKTIIFQFVCLKLFIFEFSFAFIMLNEKAIFNRKYEFILS